MFTVVHEKVQHLFFYNYVGKCRLIFYSFINAAFTDKLRKNHLIFNVFPHACQL